MPFTLSIITATYQRADLLLVSALPSLLNQTSHDFEWIVINEGRDSLTRALIVETSFPFPITYLEIDHPDTGFGLCIARNLGLDNAKGKFVCYLDDDNLLNPKFVSHVLDWLIQHPDAWGYIPRQWRRQDIDHQGKNLQVGKPFIFPPIGTTIDDLICQKAIFDANGFVHSAEDPPRFDKDYRIYCDYEYFLQCLSKEHPIKLDTHVLVDYIQSPQESIDCFDSGVWARELQLIYDKHCTFNLGYGWANWMPRMIQKYQRQSQEPKPLKPRVETIFYWRKHDPKSHCLVRIYINDLTHFATVVLSQLDCGKHHEPYENQISVDVEQLAISIYKIYLSSVCELKGVNWIVHYGNFSYPPSFEYFRENDAFHKIEWPWPLPACLGKNSHSRRYLSLVEQRHLKSQIFLEPVQNIMYRLMPKKWRKKGGAIDIPPTSPDYYISFNEALELQFFGEQTGSWARYDTFFYPEKKQKSARVAGEGGLVNTNPIFGSFGVREMSQQLEREKVLRATRPVYVADHYRAVADLIMLQIQDDYNQLLISNQQINDWMKSEDNLEYLITRFLAPLRDALPGQMLEAFEQWLTTLHFIPRPKQPIYDESDDEWWDLC